MVRPAPLLDNTETADRHTERANGGEPKAVSRPRGRIGWIVSGSLVAGPIAALLFAAAPFIRPRESEITGAVLLGFALGWAMLAVLSERFTDQPQRWALAPAAFLGSSGLLLAVFGAPVNQVLNWIWPPALLALGIWMSVRVRKSLHSRSSRLVLYPVLGLTVLASIGGGYETVGKAADAVAFPMPGKLIDVGEHSLHLSCTGSGTPTVILEPGAGNMSSSLGWISPAVASDTRVCVYDRAGRGWSEPGDTVQDAAQIAADLHTMLDRAGEEGPYVLAGHSFGGLYARTFAAAYPDEVAGLVLVDSTAAAADPASLASDDGSSDDLMRRISALVSSTARLGLTRLMAQTDYDTLPPRSGDEARSSAATASQLGGTIDEYVNAGSSAQQAAKLDDFGDKPLMVVTASVGSTADWPEEQEAMVALSTNSAQRVIAGSTHSSLLLDRHDAAHTTDAILDVVAAVRTGSPLPR